MAQIESQIQASFIAEIRFLEKTDERLRLLFSVPNGGLRTKRNAHTLKMEGQRNGIPDVILPVPNDYFVGLAIEFKKPRTINSAAGRVSIEQKLCHDLLKKYEWHVEVCFDAPTAIQLVKEHLRSAKC